MLETTQPPFSSANFEIFLIVSKKSLTTKFNQPVLIIIQEEISPSVLKTVFVSVGIGKGVGEIALSLELTNSLADLSIKYLSGPIKKLKN